MPSIHCMQWHRGGKRPSGITVCTEAGADRGVNIEEEEGVKEVKEEEVKKASK
jgi:hypothetical protein